MWVAVSGSYKPLELYKLIESVVLKQTKDQYPQYGISIVKSSMQSKEAYPTPNAMKGSTPR